ncbi:MAG: SRPBCC domain-containing protein [Acidimicrobiales bacterium]
MAAPTNTVSVEQYVARPPRQVWSALTDPALVAAWWAPGDIAAAVGHRFTLEMPGWGRVPCEVVEAVEPECLVYTFADWTLTWRLVREGSGTRLTLDHSGFDLDNPQHRFAFDNMGPGWRDDVLPRLATLVEGG